jgi:hypothetical protein
MSHHGMTEGRIRRVDGREGNALGQGFEATSKLAEKPSAFGVWGEVRGQEVLVINPRDVTGQDPLTRERVRACRFTQTHTPPPPHTPRPLALSPGARGP